MARNSRYFQFPLKALKLATVLGSPPREIDSVSTKVASRVTGKIIDYCVWKVGRGKWDKDEEVAHAMSSEYEIARDWSDGGCEPDINGEPDPGFVACCGAKILGVNYLSFAAIRRCDTSFQEIEGIPGGMKLVRMREGFVWDMFHNRISWRDFATLAAVYAGIGNQPLRRLSFNWIGTMALGFSSKVEGEPGDVKRFGMTRAQIAWTVKKLAKRGFFVLAPLNRRHNVYSHRLSQNQLNQSVAKLIVQRTAKRSAAENRTDIQRMVDLMRVKGDPSSGASRL